MGRKIMRVPLDFAWPLDEVWKGYLLPEKFHSDPCPDCKNGHSWQYEFLHDLWYGHRPFDPAMTGSTPWLLDHPVIRAKAERNISEASWFYGSGQVAVVREAQRLADHYNNGWIHHLSQADVDALVAGNRLWEFTRKVVPGKGWVDRDEPVHLTAAQVNEWSLQGMGHDSINAYIVIRARCERYGTPTTCPTCKGHGGLETYPGQRAEAEAWEWEEPPTGPGWQLWETVSEGSPISPVFETPEQLAHWMSSPAYCWGVSRGEDNTYAKALAFVKDGWAPSFIGSDEHGLEPGEVAIGRKALEADE
jgi:hypothetical protein